MSFSIKPTTMPDMGRPVKPVIISKPAPIQDDTVVVVDEEIFELGMDATLMQGETPVEVPVVEEDIYIGEEAEAVDPANETTLLELL